MREPSKKDPQCDLNLARALTWRYVMALCLIASLTTAAWLSLHLVISKQQSTAVVVNVSGRQRMLSQRTALFSNLLVNSSAPDRPEIRVRLREAILLMERSHRGLTHGDPEMGLPAEMSAAVRAMYFDGPNALDGQVETYIRMVRELLALDDVDLAVNIPLLSSITENARNPLVVALDKMVGQYQLEGEATVRRLQHAETLFWLITLLLLILEAILIFRPFVKHIGNIIAKLQMVTGELQLHRDQLEETVRVRTAELQSRNEELAESEEKFRMISTTAKDAIIIIGAEEQITYWNPEANNMFGYEAQEIIGRQMYSLLAPTEYRAAPHPGFARFTQSGVGKFVGKIFEASALRKNGEIFPVELSISAFKLQNHWQALCIIRDITERKKIEDQVRQLAFYDPLTNLPNRRLLNERLGQAMTVSKRSSHYVAMLMLDLDNFKPLNDNFGHAVGDLLLRETAHRLKACLRETDTVARFGGDEFVILLTELGSDERQAIVQARHIAEKIRVSLAEPYHLTAAAKMGEGVAVDHTCRPVLG